MYFSQFIFVFLFLLNLPINLKSQEAGNPNTQNQNQTKDNSIDKIELSLSDESLETKKLIGEEGAKSLYKVLLDSFEEFSNWKMELSYDKAYGRLSKRIGVPLAISKKINKETEEEYKNKVKGISERLPNGTYRKYLSSKLNDPKSFVLGAHVQFRKRGHLDIKFLLNNPIYIHGLVKNLEVWVSGRQKPFKLYAIMQDINKNQKLIPMGNISHLGWKRLYANIPDDFHQNNNFLPLDNRGVAFIGFLVRCHPLYTKGNFYIYFDNLSAEISRFWEDYRDLGDPTDSWK